MKHHKYNPFKDEMLDTMSERSRYEDFEDFDLDDYDNRLELPWDYGRHFD